MHWRTGGTDDLYTVLLQRGDDRRYVRWAFGRRRLHRLRRPFAHEPGEGEALWWIGMLATIKATKEQTGGQYTLVEVLAPDGFASPLHVHRFEDEGFWILEGEMTFYVGDQTIKARPGSFLFGPKEVPHAFTVDSGPARLLFFLSPAG